MGSPPPSTWKARPSGLGRDGSNAPLWGRARGALRTASSDTGVPGGPPASSHGHARRRFSSLRSDSEAIGRGRRWGPVQITGRASWRSGRGASGVVCARARSAHFVATRVMTDSPEKGIAIALPGEWAIRKLLGPVFSEIGDDIKRLYAAGRDRILTNAFNKIDNIDDGKTPNLRVTRDVLWNGAFSEDAICAEYFGGVLASSRTDDGNDDSSIQFVDAIKSLSAKQLRLHYVAYYALNKLLIQKMRHINVGQGSEIQKVEIWMASVELASVHDINIDTDPNALWRHGLLHEYKIASVDLDGKTLPYTMVKPTTFGVMLYAAAHNNIKQWRNFCTVDLGSFDGTIPPDAYATDLSSRLIHERSGGEVT